MSEKQPAAPERESSHENHELGKDQLEKAAERLKERAEKEAEKDRTHEKHEARKSAEHEAISGKEHAPGGSEKKSKKEPVHRSHKQMTYKATMRRVEGRLPAYQRGFSRFVNNDRVDKVSNVASKTVARPSGLLGGGVVAFVALLVVTFYASRYGWEVSGSEFVIFVAVGWVLGLIAELVLKLVRR